ncbi:MAG: exopolysaccharide biosynthesis polyprenyl glycosylphosphotransferase [Maricaulaceae bacterium]|nr:exopolysaccharide biosynthesis polyprenyl glycosylphosphotransferase [Maricaulaceae bacterium]
MSDRRNHPSSRIGPANDHSGPGGLDPETAGLVAAEARIAARPPSSRVNRGAFGRVLRIADLAGLTAIATAGVISVAGPAPMHAPAGHLAPVVAFTLITAILLQGFGLYRINPSAPSWRRVCCAMVAASLSGIAAIGAAWTFAPEILSVTAGFATGAAAAVTALHAAHALFIRRLARQGRLALNVVVVGATPNARRLIETNARSGAVNIIGVFDDRRTRSPSRLAGAPYLGAIDDLMAWPLLPEIDRVVLTVTSQAADRVRALLARLRGLPQPVCLMLDFEDFDPETTTLAEIADSPAAQLSGLGDDPGWQIVKRLEDIVLGGLLLIAAAPVMALVALAVRLDSPGPVFFRQAREGFNGRAIRVMKFRSMRHDPEAATRPVRQVERDDPRVTRVGSFLRKTSLDELPQLWNVVRGDMSLVGPRPHAPGMKTGAAYTSELVAEYAHRHRVKPGITGWAQVNGSRGPLHSPEAARERVRLDVEYITRASLWFDLWIILKTLPALLGDRINIR